MYDSLVPIGNGPIEVHELREEVFADEKGSWAGWADRVVGHSNRRKRSFIQGAIETPRSILGASLTPNEGTDKAAEIKIVEVEFHFLLLSFTIPLLVFHLG